MRKGSNNVGITLIALVVTIVVLLILAGVSLNLVLGNNGIITKAQDAKLMTRAGSAEDEVELWKSDNYIARTSNQATVDKETMLQGLKDKKLVYEEEIDRDNEIITIKKKDGTIVKEINYSDIVINISKTPETEKSGAVVLQVTSVDGASTIRVQDIPALDEETKKELIRKTEVICLNKFAGINITTFEEAIQYEYSTLGWLSENSEEAFWRERGNLENYIYGNIQYVLQYDSNLDIYYLCQILNPDNELSDTYVATENGTYTFIVKDLMTGNSYAKSVEVTNIDSTLQQYYVGLEGASIKLKNSETEESVTFSQAFIIYNGEKVNISDTISAVDSYNYIFCENVAYYLEDIGKTSSFSDFYRRAETFILLKDGNYYIGTFKLEEPV